MPVARPPPRRGDGTWEAEQHRLAWTLKVSLIPEASVQMVSVKHVVVQSATFIESSMSTASPFQDSADVAAVQEMREGGGSPVTDPSCEYASLLR